MIVITGGGGGGEDGGGELEVPPPPQPERVVMRTVMERPTSRLFTADHPHFVVTNIVLNRVRLARWLVIHPWVTQKCWLVAAQNVEGRIGSLEYDIDVAQGLPRLNRYHARESGAGSGQGKKRANRADSAPLISWTSSVYCPGGTGIS